MVEEYIFPINMYEEAAVFFAIYTFHISLLRSPRSMAETISLHERWCGSSEAKVTSSPLILAFSFRLASLLLCLDDVDA